MANKLYEALESRILLLDGGFGTMVQQYGFTRRITAANGSATGTYCSKAATTCWR